MKMTTALVPNTPVSCSTYAMEVNDSEDDGNDAPQMQTARESEL